MMIKLGFILEMGERFSSRKKFEKWRKKGRIIYTLVNQKGNLAGITWFGVKDGGWTLAVRLYGRARGKGWSYDFLKNSIEKLVKTDSYIESSIKTWWLECSEGNISGRKLYEKLGFVLTEKGKEDFAFNAFHSCAVCQDKSGVNIF